MKYLILLLIYFIPLYPRIEVFRIPGVATAIRFEDFVLAAIYSMWVLFLLMPKRNNRRIIPNNRITLGIVIFFVSALVSTIVGMLKGTIDAGVGLVFLLRYVEYFLMYFVVFSWASVRYFGNYLKAMISVLLVVIGITYFDGFDLIPYFFKELYGMIEGWHKGHVHGTFSHNYDLGAYLFINLALLLAVFFIHSVYKKNRSGINAGKIKRQNRKYIENQSLLLYGLKREPLITNGLINVFGTTRLSRIMFHIVLLSLIFLIILVYSRISIMAAITSAVVLGLISKPGIKILPVAVTAIFATGILVVGQYIPAILVIGSEIGTGDVSFQWRLKIWAMIMELFSKNILLGGGLSSVAKVFMETGEESFIATATECWYIRVLGEMGIIGLFCFFVFKYLILKELYERYKQSRNILLRQYYGGLFALSIGLLVNALFIDIYTSFKIILFYMLLLGLGARLAEVEKGGYVR